MWFYSLIRQFPWRKCQFIRFKHFQQAKRKRFDATEKALQHFDDFYQQIFQAKWQDIRAGLLAPQKYVAVVNNYSDTDRIKESLEKGGAINVRLLFEAEKEYSKKARVKKERQQNLAKIYKMDKEMDAKQETKEQPQTEQVNVNSLEYSLKSAELDERRLIDPSNVLSSGILHEFVPASKIKGMEDFVPESTHYQYYQQEGYDFQIKIEKQFDLNFPPNLNVYCYEEENFSDFPSAKNGSTGVLDYYLMDGASILPVLALDIQPGNCLLDMCAAPGGKTLLALQTLYPGRVVANDSSMSRTKRIFHVAKQFLYDFDENWLKTNKFMISCADGRFMEQVDQFDRVLVDVPCTTDRHSLKENENNIFKSSRIKERLKIPELQCDLLLNALKLVKEEGIVVYSTCSLSPIQNDGVVHMALKRIWEETKFEFVVRDLSPALHQSRNVFKLANRKLMNYGSLVLPDVNQNYGPMYFCKLKRIK